MFSKSAETYVEHGILIVAGFGVFVWCATYGSQRQTAGGSPGTDSLLFGSFLGPLLGSRGAPK